MKKILFAAFMFTCTAAFAVPLAVTSTTASGPYNNSLTLLTDGVFPVEGGQWQTNTVWWNGTATRIEFDLGAVYLVRDITLSVDNNDSYLVRVSADGVSWTDLFDIAIADGEIGWGMDTMTSDATSLEYLGSLEFPGTNARYLSIAATGGDDDYSVGEFQIFGDIIPGSNPVPAPGSLFLLAAGLGVLGWSRKRA